MEIERIGVLTGGGDAPGLNAVIRAIVIAADQHGIEVIGIKRGWAGLLDGGEAELLTVDQVDDIHRTGGTVLRTSRTNPVKHPNGMEQIRRNLEKYHIDALIAIGGDDTLGVANKLHLEGIKVVGVPKTIDNDLCGTDYTFGFDTAINIATEAMDRLHTTAKSHDRVLIVEIMGRYAGWLAMNAGMAGGAHIILLPEEKFDPDEVADIVKKRRESGRNYTIIAVSEGAVPADAREFITQDDKVDEFGHVKLGGIAKRLAKVIEKKTGQETRSVELGHVQRGGAPSAFDRVLGARLGLKAVNLLLEGKFGQMPALQGTTIINIPLEQAIGKLKLVDKSFIDEMKIFRGR
ncbi:MAG: 6-phosphofructokinase [Candidatus Abyssobacteria bacterium SURF_5]|uniref:Pyrophosphate--fructose 6-phosphate 1-phosphotransferase n=1 Tax=Abyssobacteria bacterium (strain SURF_5) TaxID=2093360 RepID=A0A3A4NSE8_ABYX5|nr:MAG: 6-phosphofructokinase [Candidatus Abyssubacteria bacterium SURF_5]